MMSPLPAVDARLPWADTQPDPTHRPAGEQLEAALDQQTEAHEDAIVREAMQRVGTRVLVAAALVLACVVVGHLLPLLGHATP